MVAHIAASIGVCTAGNCQADPHRIKECGVAITETPRFIMSIIIAGNESTTPSPHRFTQFHSKEEENEDTADNGGSDGQPPEEYSGNRNQDSDLKHYLPPIDLCHSSAKGLIKRAS
jgi:hypothetical protein